MSTTTRSFTRFTAGLLSAVLALGALAGFAAPAANAANSDGIRLELVTNGVATHNGTPVLTPGSSYSMRLIYDTEHLTDGSTTIISVDDSVSIPDSALVVPAGNTIIESIVRQADGSLAVTFKDPIDRTIATGVFMLNFDVDAVETSERTELNWQIDGVPTTTQVIVLAPGDTPKNVTNSTNKSAGGANLGSAVSVVDGTVVVSDSILGTEIPYTLSLSTTTALSDYTITDQIDSSLAYVPSSFTATISAWDADGLNKTTAPFAISPAISGNTFALNGLTVPANSEVTVRYTATVKDADAIAELQAALQTKYEAVAAAGGNYSVSLGNSATFGGGTPKTASISVGGNVAAPSRPNVGGAFTKGSSLTGETLISVPADGSLADPIPVDFTLRADLRVFTGETPRHVLSRDVVITDALPAQLRWSSDADVITVTGGSLTFTRAADGTPASALLPGEYAFNGQTLAINVGQDNTANYTITAKAEVYSMAGLSSWTDGQGAKHYSITNTAQYTYDDVLAPHQASTGVGFIDRGDTSGGIDDPNTFSKRAPTAPVQMTSGESATVPFTFIVGDGKADLANSRIIDHIDHSVFDVSDLAAIKAATTVKYDYWRTVPAEDFTLTLNADGDLELAFTASFAAHMAEWGAVDKRLEIVIPVPTKPITGKGSFEVVNRGTLIGAKDGITYTSRTTAEGSTYGTELELRKTVYDAGSDSYTNNLRAEVDAEGDLVNNEFIYRVQLIPHGDFGGITVGPFVDVLPDGVEFVGFVAPSDVSTGTVTPGTTISMGGNMTASYDAGANTVSVNSSSIQNVSGIQVNFKVRLVDAEANVGVTNRIAGTSATITPTNEYPLSIAKVDASDPTVKITDRNARFEVLDASGDVVVSDIYVVDGTLRVAGDLAVTVREPGSYTVRELTPPAGYALSTIEYPVTVSADGSSPQVRFLNVKAPVDPEPVLSYAIGDIVWIDADKDGLQNDSEILAGVGVSLTDAAGEPVRNIHGDVVSAVTTDAQGRYVFDELPAGDYRVTFTLTEAQAAIYEFTKLSALAPGTDSNAIVDAGNSAVGATTLITLGASNTALVSAADYAPTGRTILATQGIDPTWDAGVVLKAVDPEPTPKVSLGDLVWVDSNGDGLWSEGEPGIPGVTLVLTGPNGERVVDVDGVEVAPVVTDSDGRYSFDNLPPLVDGQSYTVTIDKAASAEALAPYVPTRDDAEGEFNSSTDSATSTGLTADGDRDPTLDFGFVLAPPPSFAVGDFVWIDANSNGRQDDTEVLAGVTVELTDAEGNPVRDIHGDVVTSVTTDAAGRYLFDELPAGDYRVRFTLTPAQAEKYQFTTQGTGDAAGDSTPNATTGITAVFTLGVPADTNNTVDASGYPGVVADFIDPTIDAGVVLRPVLVGGATPPGTVALQNTGLAVNGAWLAIVALMLGAGSLLVVARRRMS